MDPVTFTPTPTTSTKIAFAPIPGKERPAETPIATPTATPTDSVKLTEQAKKQPTWKKVLAVFATLVITEILLGW
jgi:hypothetical protein